MNRLLKPFIFLLAGIYLVMDAVFMAVAKPVAGWLADRRIFDGLRRWIVSLGPYPTLALFVVPLVVLEPIKPVAAYLAATTHVKAGIAILVIGEVLKFIVVERLFTVSRDKLMSIAAFAWAHGQYRQIMDWIQATEAWQAVRRLTRIAQYAVRIYLMEFRASQKPALISFQSR